MPTTKTQSKTEQPVVAVRRQSYTGLVVSTKMKDTAVVSIERFIKHIKYGKRQIRRTKLMAHDPGNTKKEGERVVIEACRPISKNKSFKVVA